MAVGGGDESIDIRATFADEISGPARAAAASVDELGDEALGTAAELKVMGAAASGASRDVDGLGASSAAAAKQVGAHRKGLKGAAKDTAKVGDESDKARRKLGKLFTFGFKFRGLLMGLKIGAVLQGLPMLSSGIQGLGAAAYAGVAGLAPLVGLLGALPALAGTAASAMAVGKMGIYGMADALKVLNDPKATQKQWDEALKKLAPEAADAIVELSNFDKMWKKLRRNVQGQLFEGIAPLIASLGDKYLPVLNEGLQQMAMSLNSVIKFTAKWLGKTKTVQRLGRIMNTNAYVARHMGYGLSRMLDVVLKIADAARPMVEEMADGFHRATFRLQEFVTKNPGKLRVFFVKAWALAKRVGKVFWDIGWALFNIGKMSGGMSQALGGDIETLATKFRDWTESVGGQGAIKKWFDDMIPVVREIAALIWSVISTVWRLRDDAGFIRISQMLRNDLLPVLETMFKKAKDSGLLETLVGLVTDFAKAWDEGLFGSVIGIINGIGDAFHKFVDWFTDLPAPVKKAIAYFVTFASIFGKFNFGLLSFGKGKFFSKLKDFGKWLLPLIRTGLSALLGPWGLVVLAVIGLVWWLVHLYKKGGKFKEFVDGIVTSVRDFWNNQLKPFLAEAKAFWDSDIYPAIMKFAALLEWFFNTILLPYYGFVWEVLKKILGAWWWFVQNIGWPLFKFVIQLFSGLMDFLAAVIPYVMAFWNAGWALLTGFWKSVGDTISAYLQPVIWIIGKIVDGIRWAIDNAGRIPTPGDVLSALNPFDNPDQNYRGGSVMAGGLSWVGEQGPEAFITRGGNIGMLGLNGPQLGRFPASGAVIPAGATVDPFSSDAGRAPDWAMSQYRKAMGTAGGSEGRKTKTASVFSPQITLQVYPQTELDIEHAVLSAVRQYENERRERQ